MCDWDVRYFSPLRYEERTTVQVVSDVHKWGRWSHKVQDLERTKGLVLQEKGTRKISQQLNLQNDQNSFGTRHFCVHLDNI